MGRGRVGVRRMEWQVDTKIMVKKGKKHEQLQVVGWYAPVEVVGEAMI